MNRFFSISLLVCISLIIFCGCNTGTAVKAPEKPGNKPDTSVGKPPDSIPPLINIPLIDADFNSAKLITNNRLSTSPICSPIEIKSLSINKIDSAGTENKDFKYHLIDTVFNSRAGFILLIGREWPSENIVWLASYDISQKLIDKQEVYYDNAEGFLAIESRISNKELSITTTNEFDEGSKTIKTRFTLSNELKWTKIK